MRFSQFSLRFEPILKIVAKQPAPGAADLVGAVQDFLDHLSRTDGVRLKDNRVPAQREYLA